MPAPMSTATATATAAGRPGHRRAYTTVPFGDHHHHALDDDILGNIPPALRINPNNSFRISIPATDDAPLRTVPFPRSSSLSPTPTQPPQRPTFARTASSPVLLSNGKPLKSSLKSSSSSPHIPPQPLQPTHLRARSAPSTPHLAPKNVHFPTNEATVRVFNRSGKPASLSRPNAEDTETETEGELSTDSGFIRGASSILPFPRSPLSRHHHSHHNHPARYEIDSTASSQIPIQNPPSHANVYLESISYSQPDAPSSSSPRRISGSLLVRNLAYEKQLAVRFTLDDWQTTSEVSAKYLTSLSALPPSFLSHQAVTYGDLAALSSPQWDRFTFTIKLEDYAAHLSRRTLFLVVRYIANAVSGPIESWDNNMGRNYKIAFRDAAPPSPPQQQGRRERVFAVSSPPSFTPATTSKPAIVTTPAIAVSSPSPPPFSATTTTPQQGPDSAHAHLVAQATILRLRKLNLKNYAAPSLTTTSPVAASSNRPAFNHPGGDPYDQGPQTDLQGFRHPNQGMEILGGFPAHLRQQDAMNREGSASSSGSESGSESGGSEESLTTPITMVTTRPTAALRAKQRSRSPSPPGIVTDMTSGQEFQFPIPNTHAGDHASTATALDMGTSPPFSLMADLGRFQNKRREVVTTTQNGDIHWPWGLFVPPQQDTSEDKVKELLAGIREKSTSSPVRRGGSPTNSNASGRKSPPRTRSPENEEALTVVSPQPTTTRNASGWGRPSASPILFDTPATTTTSTGDNAGADVDVDSVYQAVVRQWCFAQGPGPTARRTTGEGPGSGPGSLVV